MAFAKEQAQREEQRFELGLGHGDAKGSSDRLKRNIQNDLDCRAPKALWRRLNLLSTLL